MQAKVGTIFRCQCIYVCSFFEKASCAPGSSQRGPPRSMGQKKSMCLDENFFFLYTFIQFLILHIYVYSQRRKN
jgi:hypothetical protein